jgi:chitinase
MSYDLHGTWDSTSVIGDTIGAHTNLTEIKEAVDLFWRAGVHPEQLVLGTGFYGRSYQLKHSDCDTPGCPFKGVAKAGKCTDAPGTLGYFEIMDIIHDMDHTEKTKPDTDQDHDTGESKSKRSDNAHNNSTDHSHKHHHSHGNHEHHPDHHTTKGMKKGPVHDKEAAVKYLKYDHDQWVSYDDKDTFDQKVKWANSLG